MTPSRFPARPPLVALLAMALIGSMALIGCSATSPVSAPTASSSATVGPASADAAPVTGPAMPGSATPGSPTPRSPDSGTPDAGGERAGWTRAENQQAGSDQWRIASLARDQELAGFADASSVLPGQKVTLRVTSTATSFSGAVFRLGYYAGRGARQVATIPTAASVRQPAARILPGQMVSARHWTPGPVLDTTGWPSGSYLIKLTDDRGRGKYIPLTVRSRDFAGKLLLVSATTTYQAYNQWGGYSLYKGPTAADPHATRVSFDRPYDTNGARHASGYEQPFIALAEQLGIDTAYATSQDLEAGPAGFAGVRGLVSMGHDEYWSVPMRSTVERLRDAGANLAFMGANAVYWRVRFTDAGRTMIGYKTYPDPVTGPTSSGLWRDYRPESTLTGQLYECFPAKGALVVANPDNFLLAGTGARRGSSYPGLVGVEIDRAYPSPLSPASTEVVAHSPVQCADRGTTFSDLTYYTADSGAGVVAVGTMDWRRGLSRPTQPPPGLTRASVEFVTTVTTNLFTAMAAGPLGAAHPGVPNLTRIAPALTTSTGTGGAVTAR